MEVGRNKENAALDFGKMESDKPTIQPIVQNMETGYLLKRRRHRENCVEGGRIAQSLSSKAKYA